MKKEHENQNGRVNYVWVLAGGYLIYLGGRLLYGLFTEGADSLPLWVAIPAAVVFAAAGAMLLRREGKAYQYAAAHKDDPATWNDELAENAASAESNPPEKRDREEDSL